MIRPRIFLDSNVILDVTVPPTGRESEASAVLFRALEEGRLEATVIAPVITEVYYITFEETANEARSTDVIENLVGTKGIEVVGLSDIVAQKAGRFISKYNYSIVGKKAYHKPVSDCLSVVDSFLLAAASLTPDSLCCSHERKFKAVTEVMTKTPRELMEGR